MGGRHPGTSRAGYARVAVLRCCGRTRTGPSCCKGAPTACLVMGLLTARGQGWRVRSGPPARFGWNSRIRRASPRSEWNIGGRQGSLPRSEWNIGAAWALSLEVSGKMKQPDRSILGSAITWAFTGGFALKTRSVQGCENNPLTSRVRAFRRPHPGSWHSHQTAFAAGRMPPRFV